VIRKVAAELAIRVGRRWPDGVLWAKADITSASSARGLLLFIVLPASRKDGTGDKKRRRLPALPDSSKRSQEIPGRKRASGLKTGLRESRAAVARQGLVAAALFPDCRLLPQ
jgi:hypothetical protein